jgi:hypothetical protein
VSSQQRITRDLATIAKLFDPEADGEARGILQEIAAHVAADIVRQDRPAVEWIVAALQGALSAGS